MSAPHLWIRRPELILPPPLFPPSSERKRVILPGDRRFDDTLLAMPGCLPCLGAGGPSGPSYPAGAIVYDTFTDTAGTNLDSHTGEVGATWTKMNSGSWTGTMGLSNANRIRNLTVGSGFYRAYYASGAVPANCQVTANFYYAGSVSNAAMHIGVRVQNATSSNGYWAGYWNGFWQIWFPTLGTNPTNLTSAVTLNAGQTYNCVYTVTTSASNTTQLFVVDGTTIFNDTRTTALSGAGLGVAVAGFNASDDDTHGVHLSDILAVAS